MKYFVMNSRISGVSLVLLALVLATACNSGKKQSPMLVEDVDQETVAKEGVSLTLIYHLYPSPAEMLGVINLSELNFDAGLMLEASKMDQFFDSKSRSLALGVYATDLAFAALFGRHGETLDYLETVKSLSEEVDIIEAVDEEMIEKARTNVEFLDSLYTISNDAFMNILSYCDRNERSNTVVLISAGAFIESLYLATHLVEDYQMADDILQHLAEQKLSINNFMRFAKGLNSEDTGVKETIADLERIQLIYDGVDVGSGKAEVKTADAGGEGKPKKLVIGAASPEAPGLSETQFNELKSLVVELRNNIVEVQ